MSILGRETTGSRPWGDPLNRAFLQNPHLSQRDKAFVSHLVNGVWRWRGRLDWMISRASSRPLNAVSPVVLNILRLALYQILYMDRVPESAAVNEAVMQAKAKGMAHAAPFVNGLLRNLCRRSQEISFPDLDVNPIGALAAIHSYPQWLAARWVDEFGVKEAESLLQAQNRIPSLDVRVNRLKTTPEKLRAELHLRGLTASPIKDIPEGLCIEGLEGRVDQLEAFKAGMFLVQDRAAQVAAHLLAPRQEERILDLCSGFGGKTAHLAELTGDRARVTALDIHPGRLILLRRAMTRLGLHRIYPVAADGAQGLYRLFKCRFDAILLDAPCSGLGVLSRHPDGKWNRTEKDSSRLALLQKELLWAAAAVLRPGGRMLFVTCTIMREENEGVIKEFLHAHGDMTLVDLQDRAPAWAAGFIDNQGFFRTLPHIHHMDGFFGALLERR